PRPLAHSNPARLPLAPRNTPRGVLPLQHAPRRGASPTRPPSWGISNTPRACVSNNSARACPTTPSGRLEHPSSVLHLPHARGCCVCNTPRGVLHLLHARVCCLCNTPRGVLQR